MAVSSTLSVNVRVHTQAARNVNEGISYLNVADGATSALKDILFRLRELSTQSSNATFSNAQRQSIDKESQALQAEYGRILDSTSYNGIRVFGSGDMVAQAGFGAQAALVVNISSTVGGSTSTSSVTGDGTFQARQSFGTGNGPGGVTAADLNGDGVSDLVTADYGNSDGTTASVLLGNGNGTFKARQSFLTGPAPGSVTVADFNGDGKNDLVTNDGGGTTGSVLLGNGNGTFQAMQTVATGAAASVWWISVGDFNGDGVKDLVSADYSPNTVSVLLGNGDGSFQARQSFATVGSAYVAVADLNGDGKSDVVTADMGAARDGTTASVLLGNGNGTFQARQPFGTGTGPGTVAAADLNGDGKNDLVTANWGDNDESVLLGNGDGTFQARQSFTAGTWPNSVVVVDLNGDGNSDLVDADTGVNCTGTTVSVLLGNGNGTFHARQSFGTGTAPFAVAVADFNGDGVNDLVSADFGSASGSGTTVSVLLGNGMVTTTTTMGGLQPITGVSLATQAEALSAQGQIDSYLESVNKVSGAIGTALSRSQIAAQTASSVADGSQEAEARITDADVADNTAALVRTQILQQASSAILAQANQQPALALTLLHE